MIRPGGRLWKMRDPVCLMTSHPTPSDKKATLLWLETEATPGEIEDWVDRGVRHTPRVEPRSYLDNWLYVARHFGFATHDNSWGEFEKEFAIIVKRMIVAERALAAHKIEPDDDK